MKQVITFLLFVMVLITGLPSLILANSPPVVSNVTAAQRADASKLVDIYYDLTDADGDNCTVWVFISNNDGLTWDVPAFTLVGDVGAGIAPGVAKHIIWDAGNDIIGESGSYRARIFADDGQGGDDMVLVPDGIYPPDGGSQWVYVGTYFIDKYEVTNLRYCEFLNAADPNGANWGSQQEIARAGSPGNYHYVVYPGKENYPIRYVSYFDAVAFAQWRSSVTGLKYSVPDKYKWQKAAAWDPVEMRFYLYGYHSDVIDCNWCNYTGCVGTPTPVGYYNGTGGRNDAKSFYDCYDMSGNVGEFTTESCAPYYLYLILRGGAFTYSTDGCKTTAPNCEIVNYRNAYYGIRLVMEVE